MRIHPTNPDFRAGSDDPVPAKLALRAAVLAARGALAEDERVQGSRKAAARLLRLPELQRCRTALVTLPFGSEIDTQPLVDGLRRRGVELAVPAFDRIGHGMAVVRLPEGAALVRGPLGVPQPAARVPVALDALDLLVVPAIAFDTLGYRVGYGKGYFDRLLARPEVRGFTVGFGFDLQVVDEAPREPHDVPLQALVTEARTLRWDR